MAYFFFDVARTSQKTTGQTIMPLMHEYFFPRESVFIEPLPGNDKEMHVQTHIQRDNIISLLLFLQTRERKLKNSVRALDTRNFILFCVLFHDAVRMRRIFREIMNWRRSETKRQLS